MDESFWTIESWALAVGCLMSTEYSNRRCPGEGLVASSSTKAMGCSAPRVVVGGAGPGAVETISDAVQNAVPGTRILVRPGWYRESVVLDRPVEIIGDGPADKIIIESVDAPCILARTGHALVRGLTMRSSEHFTVEIGEGEMILEDCDLSSGWFACIVAQGDGTNPTIRGCNIHDGQQRGIVFTEHAGGIVEDCEIYRNTQAGVMVERSANPLIRRCKIYDGNASGIHVTGGGAGVIEECEVFGNAGANVDVEQGGNPIVRRTQIHNGARQGVYFTQYGRGVLEECEVFGNGWAGIAILGNSTPEVVRCRIHNGAENGILISDADGTIVECDIYGNVEAGALVTRASNPTLRECHFHDGPQYGVQITRGARADFDRCEFSRNAWAGVEISEGAAPRMRHCRIHHGLDAGVAFRSGAGGSLEECDVRSNARAGVLIEAGCDPVITGRIDGILHKHSSTCEAASPVLSANSVPDGETSDGAVAA